jgi:carboxylesterase
LTRGDFAALAGASLAAASITGCGGEPPPEAAAVPLQTYTQSRDGIRAKIAADQADPAIAKPALPRLYDHGKRVDRAVVLFHGFTNCPQQFEQLGRAFHGRGANVYVPRIPFHGFADRVTQAPAALDASLLQRASEEAYGFATGLGEQVSVLGLSLGGAMSMWLAQTQPVDHAVPVSPFLMPIGFGHAIGTFAMSTLRAIPDMYWWWDPRVKADCKPDYAYPGYPTHALSEIVFFANSILAQDRYRPKARRMTLVTNKGDPAVNNGIARGLLARWKAQGAPDGAYSEYTFTDLGPPRHDIIDPTTFPAATTLVYPRLETIGLSA